MKNIKLELKNTQKIHYEINKLEEITNYDCTNCKFIKPKPKMDNKFYIKKNQDIIVNKKKIKGTITVSKILSELTKSIKNKKYTSSFVSDAFNKKTINDKMKILIDLCNEFKLEVKMNIKLNNGDIVFINI